MKLKFFWRYMLAFIAAVLTLSCLSSCNTRVKLKEPITFIVATDLHYIAPSLIGDGSFFGTISETRNDGKLVHYAEEITDAFLDEIVAKRPQALILSGDLTLNGALESHKSLIEKLLRVKEQGIDILVIPGNHDVDMTAVSYAGEKLQVAEAVTSDEFYSLYSCFMQDGVVSRDENSLSYIYNASEKLWILMLDTNIFGKGFVKDGTLLWLDEQLAMAKDKGIDVISVSHQNLYAHSEHLSFGYQLYNYQELIELYEKYSVQCNFSGHIHVQSIMNEGVPEIVTSSMAITGLHYGEIICDGRGFDYSIASVNVDRYAEEKGMTDENLLNCASYATDYFEEVARVQVRKSFKESELREDEVELLAETYAKINSAYFEGRRIDLSAYSDGIELWRDQGNSFFLRYIETMIKETESENQSITVKFK